MAVGCRDRRAPLRLALERVVSVNEQLEPPIVGLRHLLAQLLKVTFELGNVSANCPFGMARSGLAPIQVALVARVARDGVENLFVVAHVSCDCQRGCGFAPPGLMVSAHEDSRVPGERSETRDPGATNKDDDMGPGSRLRRVRDTRSSPLRDELARQVGVEALDAAFMAVARLLDATEWRLGRRDRDTVDADHAGLQRIA